MDVLADFLRRRRATLRPEDVGLYPGRRRRVEGMRREEVATLADMSVNYYARLEQGKGPQPSPSMLMAISRALHLDLDEREYLFRVAGHTPPERPLNTSEVPLGLMHMLERFGDTPAFIFTELGEVLVANELANRLFGRHTSWTGLDRFDVYRWFTNPASRDFYPPEDREAAGRTMVANLRAVQGRLGPSSQAAELARALKDGSPEFAELWDRHEVARRIGRRKAVLHPELGRLELDCQAMFTEDGDQILLVLTAEPGSASREKLDRLAASGGERETPGSGEVAAASADPATTP